MTLDLEGERHTLVNAGSVGSPLDGKRPGKRE